MVELELGLQRVARGRALAVDPGRVAVFVTGVAWLALVAVALPQQLVQDSWLALTSGREIVEHGLPHVDTLTVWTSGREWIDQQWLGQLFYFGLAQLGGVRLVLLVHALALVAAFAIALATARRLGSSATSAVVVGLAVMGVAQWGLQMRTQDLGELFFVATLALLVRDAQAPSRRVYWVIPILVLWANVHGSVVLACVFVALRSLGLAAHEGHRRRALVLLGAAAAAPVASPYGFSLVGYYHHMLANPRLHAFIDEWGPSTFSTRTAIFYALALVAVWTLAKNGQLVTPFARFALLITLVAAITSVRNIIWFGLCALVVLPRLFDPYFERLEFRGLRRMAQPVAAAACAVTVAVACFALTRSEQQLTAAWPTAAADRIASLADGTRDGLVFADSRYADWLLWAEPDLRGRIAYDVRFELFSTSQITKLSAFSNRIGDDWRGATNGYAVVVFEPALHKEVRAGLLAHRRFHVDSETARLAILAR